MPEEYNISIEVTDKFTGDVGKCLEIFYRQTSGSTAGPNPNDWGYWFLKNPYGNGLYSIARDGDKIIGFCSLIPIEMVVNKNIIRGAKAEFLFVLPEYRKRIAKNLKTPVSVALLTRLYTESYNYNFNLIFGVATKAAAKAHLLAGKKPMDLELVHYFTFFKKRDFKEFGTTRNLLYKHGSFFLTSLLRKTIRVHKSSGFSILKNIDSIENINPELTGKNELLYHDRKMLNFRFIEKDSLVYEVNNPQKDYLVFNKPSENGRVFLRHWSSLNLSKDTFASIFMDLFKRCQESGAVSLNLAFSGINNDLGVNFSKFGFLSRKFKDVLLLYKSNPELKLSYNAADWYFTDSYRGFI